MSDQKTEKASTPDSLAKASKDAGIALSESELNKVAGGFKVNQDVTVSKVKTADKQQQAMTDFIKG
jgi:hypothetical protein